jgi:hypothetical protein
MSGPLTRSKKKVTASDSRIASIMTTSAGGSTATTGTSQSGQQTASATTGGQSNSRYEYTMNSSNVKMTVMLLSDRTNFLDWHYALRSCAIQKGAKGAVEAAMPDTAEDAAVKHLIQQSIPAMWHGEVTQRPSAFDLLKWLGERCTGGKDTDINDQWKKQLRKGMIKGETVQEWCHRVIRICHALKKNSDVQSDRQICRYMIDGFPAVLQDKSWAIAAAKSEPHDMLETILAALDTMG